MNLKVDEWGRGGEGQGMVVTRQGEMSGRLWVDVDVDIVFVDDMVVVVNTLYIDDLRIDDQSSMLASSFLSKSTIEIDDPTVSRPDF